MPIRKVGKPTRRPRRREKSSVGKVVSSRPGCGNSVRFAAILRGIAGGANNQPTSIVYCSTADLHGLAIQQPQAHRVARVVTLKANHSFPLLREISMKPGLFDRAGYRRARYRLSFSLLSLCVLLLLGPGAAEAADTDAPNVVLIISDDQSWTDYGFMGHPTIQTPHLDKLGEAERFVSSRLCADRPLPTVADDLGDRTLCPSTWSHGERSIPQNTLSVVPNGPRKDERS